MILSLDPGSSKIGWAITNFNGDIVDFGLFNVLNESNKDIPFNKRMNILIKSLIEKFTGLLDRGITNVVWEIVPSFGRMASRELVQATAITLKVLTFQRKLDYQQYTPGYWHKKFTDNTKCTKSEVKAIVLEENLSRKRDEQLPVDAPYDVYDAIAIGLVAGRVNEWIKNESI